MDSTLKVDPGCLVVPVARFKDRFSDLTPRPPTRASTCPVRWSMMVMEICGWITVETCSLITLTPFFFKDLENLRAIFSADDLSANMRLAPILCFFI